MRLNATGSCHCGAVTVSLRYMPAAVTECHCSLCRKYATLWAYYPVADVVLSGPTEIYAWGRNYLSFHRCANCGSVMGWWARGEYPECAINARMLDGFDLTTVTLIVEDDASV